MSKAKTASKNNPTSREQAKEFYHNGKKIKTVKVISKNSFFAAEYEESGDLVVDSNGKVLPWRLVTGLSRS